MVSLCFSQDASIHMQLALLRSLGDLDLRSNFDLDLSRSSYMFADVHWRGKHNGVKSIDLSSNTEVIIEKTVSLKNCIFDLSWPVTPKQLTLGEIWDTLAKERFKSFLVLFKFCSSSYRDGDNVDNLKPCHTIRKFWFFLPLMTSGDLNFDLSE